MSACGRSECYFGDYNLLLNVDRSRADKQGAYLHRQGKTKIARKFNHVILAKVSDWLGGYAPLNTCFGAYDWFREVT